MEDADLTPTRPRSKDRTKERTRSERDRSSKMAPERPRSRISEKEKSRSERPRSSISEKEKTSPDRDRHPERPRSSVTEREKTRPERERSSKMTSERSRVSFSEKEKPRSERDRSFKMAAERPRSTVAEKERPRPERDRSFKTSPTSHRSEPGRRPKRSNESPESRTRTPDDSLRRLRLEKTRRMAEVIAEDRRRNESSRPRDKTAYYFNYSARSNDGPDRRRGGAKNTGRNRDDYNIRQLLDAPKPHFRVRVTPTPPLGTPTAPPRTPSASSTSSATATSSAPFKTEEPVKPDPAPLDSTRADGNGDGNASGNADGNGNADFVFRVPLPPPPPRSVKRKVCWFCPVCDHYDANEEQSQRRVENHVREGHLRCFLDVRRKTYLCPLCKEDLENTTSLMAHWIARHPRHYEQVLTLNGYSKKELTPVPFDRSQCPVKVKCLRCTSSFSEMRHFWVHLAVDHYADVVLPRAHFKAVVKAANKAKRKDKDKTRDDKTAIECLFEGCEVAFKTRVAMIAHMAAAHELMQKYFGTIIQNDLFLRVD